jgi:hypothetical protein
VDAELPPVCDIEAGTAAHEAAVDSVRAPRAGAWFATILVSSEMAFGFLNSYCWNASRKARTSSPLAWS